jgi:hypothetical protein
MNAMTTTSISARHTSSATARYVGEVVYIYAFDVAYDTARKPINQLLGQPVAEEQLNEMRTSGRQSLSPAPH